MHGAPFRNRVNSGGERLPEYLTTKDLGRADVMADAAIDVLSLGLEAQQVNQFSQCAVH